MLFLPQLIKYLSPSPTPLCERERKDTTNPTPKPNFFWSIFQIISPNSQLFGDPAIFNLFYNTLQQKTYESLSKYFFTFFILVTKNFNNTLLFESCPHNIANFALPFSTKYHAGLFSFSPLPMPTHPFKHSSLSPASTCSLYKPIHWANITSKRLSNIPTMCTFAFQNQKISQRAYSKTYYHADSIKKVVRRSNFTISYHIIYNIIHARDEGN